MVRTWRGALGFTALVLCLALPGQAYHIPTVSEGLLSEPGCYVGAYLGGNQGANNALCVNYFMKAQTYPYETQYLDHPFDYGEKQGKGPAGIDTGIASFRSDLDTIQTGSGAKQILISRYYDMNFYPDNNYGKIPYVPSEEPYVWAERVIQQGGVPVLVFDPYALTNSKGVLDLSVKSASGKNGTQILQDLATHLNAVAAKYPDKEGRPATVIIWFAHEFNTAPSVNPEANDLVDSPNKKAFRQVFRQAYAILHQYGGDGIQVAWAGNIAQTKEDREYYWPGYDDTMAPLPDDSVDWVGMTWYPWPGGPTTLDRFQGFYDFFSVNRSHPFIFMETSADGWGDPATEETLKAAQVRYLYNATTLSAYPNIKGIIWFNVVKGEQKTPSDQTLVTKNFLIPDGQWDNHGQSAKIAGDVYSASNKSLALLPLYPRAMADPYFLPAVIAPGAGRPETLSADFSADTLDGTVPLTVQFSDLSTGSPTYWLYRFGDGTTSASPRPTHTYLQAGTYTVSLTVSSLGPSGLVQSSTEKTAYITVNPEGQLTAAFTSSPTTGKAPLQVRFSDESTGSPDRYLYRFGDGSYSLSQSPLHTYWKPGTYTVTLTVWGIGNDLKPLSSTTVKQDLVVVS
jgi:PKD repeat protein